jgi:TonB family protein
MRTVQGLVVAMAMGVLLSCAPSRATRAGSSEGIRAPKLIQPVEPDYPAELRKQGVTGVVVIGGTVPKEGGAMRNPHVVRTDDPRLNQPALNAVSRWLWRAGLQNGEPVDVEFTTEVRFRLTP